MKFVTMCGLFVTCLLLIGANLIAQEPAEDQPTAKPAAAKKKATESEPQDIRYLAEPLSDIRTNILNLERAGYFAIEKTSFLTRANGDEAIVWTVRMKKTATCKHIEVMLREFRDARFYSTIETQRLEVVVTLMHYSHRISLGSSSNRLLTQDEKFELWIDLPPTFLQKLITQHADTLVLRRWRY